MPIDSEGHFEVDGDNFWRYKNGILYLHGNYFRYENNTKDTTPIFNLDEIPDQLNFGCDSIFLFQGIDTSNQEIWIEVDEINNKLLVFCRELAHEFYFYRFPIPLF